MKIKWNEKKWNGMEWNGIELNWNEKEWKGIGLKWNGIRAGEIKSEKNLLIKINWIESNGDKLFV